MLIRTRSGYAIIEHFYIQHAGELVGKPVQITAIVAGGIGIPEHEYSWDAISRGGEVEIGPESCRVCSNLIPTRFIEQARSQIRYVQMPNLWMMPDQHP